MLRTLNAGISAAEIYGRLRIRFLELQLSFVIMDKDHRVSEFFSLGLRLLVGLCLGFARCHVLSAEGNSPLSGVFDQHMQMISAHFPNPFRLFTYSLWPSVILAPPSSKHRLRVRSTDSLETVHSSKRWDNASCEKSRQSQYTAIECDGITWRNQAGATAAPVMNSQNRATGLSYLP